MYFHVDYVVCRWSVPGPSELGVPPPQILVEIEAKPSHSKGLPSPSKGFALLLAQILHKVADRKHSAVI